MVEFRNFIPVSTVDLGGAIILIIVIAGLLYKYKQWVRVTPTALFKDASTRIGTGGVVGAFFSELGERVILGKDIITDSRVRWATHFMIFWGFVGLGFATTWVYIFYPSGAPRPLTDPGKIVGNIGGALVLIGSTVILLRYALVEKYRKGRLGDVIFFTTLYLGTLSGFATELARMWLVALAAYEIYAMHLVIVSVLLVTAPFTHFSHAIVAPLMRYMERLQKSLVSKGTISYNDYRKQKMSEDAEHAWSSDQSHVAAPDWLGDRKTFDE